MFNPFATDTGIQRYQADKLQRWSMTMTTYRYVIEHVRGEDNIWANLLSRWSGPSTPMDQSLARMHQIVLVPAVSPLAECSFAWPTFAEICAAQQLQQKQRPEHVTWNGSKARFVFGGDRVWIPGNGDLIPRICVVVHAGRSVHRGKRTTASAISAWCWWAKHREYVSRFVKSCIHCIATGDGREPRPYGPAIHATAPNEVLHFDYLTLPEDEDSGHQYVLVLMDDFSGFVELWATANPDTSSCAAALQAWFNGYGVVKEWISDRVPPSRI
ncbi:unnamed protein product [Phytophthora fragariaefolia]|uniref:Unnamed protein product n=1 Tax=Phytophthora fragariaefolia TaxID=1490495 RepID=A0A9W7CUW2_9STRA|nr:unnamed protein product [Phytophthora fragariaefolia]